LPGTGDGTLKKSVGRIKLACKCEPHAECTALRIQVGEKQCGSDKKECKVGLLGSRKYAKKDYIALI